MKKIWPFLVVSYKVRYIPVCSFACQIIDYILLLIILLKCDVTCANLEKASTHNSAQTHADTVFSLSDLHLLTPINWFPGLTVEHYCVSSLVILAALVFEISCR